MLVGGSAIVLLIITVFGEISAEHCIKDLQSFSSQEAAFVQCAINSASESNTCIKCYKNYENMFQLYEKLLSECPDRFFNKNRFNVLYNIHKSLIEIWERGYCDECFDGQNISNSTSEFQKLMVTHNDCILTNLPSPCDACIGTYIQLNDFYRQLVVEKKGNICFDIQNAMNQTQSAWSKNYKCCRRVISIKSFLGASLLLGSIPIIFYFGMYMHTKRMERNHDHLDSNYDADNHAPVASTSGTARTLLNHSVENETPPPHESDDEMLLPNDENMAGIEQDTSTLIQI